MLVWYDVIGCLESYFPGLIGDRSQFSFSLTDYSSHTRRWISCAKLGYWDVWNWAHWHQRRERPTQGSIMNILPCVFFLKIYTFCSCIFNSMLRYFFCMVWSKGLTSFFNEFNQHHLFKRLLFPHCVIFVKFVIFDKSSDQKCESLFFDFWVLFHSFVYLFLRQYHTVFYYYSFMVSFEIGKCKSSNIILAFPDSFDYPRSRAFPYRF